MDDIQKEIIDKLSKLEKQFSRNRYGGGGNKNFIIKKGTIPVIVSAPHAIIQLREGQIKWSDKLTGALALFLHLSTGCHAICSARYSEADYNYDTEETKGNPYQIELAKYIVGNDIKVLIDLHGASINREFAIEMGTAPLRNEEGEIIGDKNLSLHGRTFISNLVKYTFDFIFRDLEADKKEIWHNRVFDAGTQNTVTKYISSHTSCSCIQLEINSFYRDVNNPDPVLHLVDGLTRLINTLGNIDWSACKIEAFRLWQSTSHKPQDKVELSETIINESNFKKHDLYYICSWKEGTETVRLHPTTQGNINHLNKDLMEDKIDLTPEVQNEYLFLTNRLIETLYGREWIQGKEKRAYLRDAPIILYEISRDTYNLGLPKANQIDQIFFSSELYNSKQNISDKYEFVLFNRFTDSRFFIDFKDADYQDYGRVKDNKGQPAMKVMVPRYYRRLLGYINNPMLVVREEEYINLLKRIKEDAEKFLSQIYEAGKDSYILNKDFLELHKCQKIINLIPTDFLEKLPSEPTLQQFEDHKKNLSREMIAPLEQSYEKIFGEVFYALKDEIKNKKEFQNLLDKATLLLKYYGFYDSIELLRIPKKSAPKLSFYQKINGLIEKIFLSILKRIIGDVKYSLRAEWTTETDDKNNVARLSPNMMSLIGVEENDKIIIKFGERKQVLRVLANKELSDYQIGIPAPTRKKLGMNSINDIVIVSRDMKHAFMRNSQEQTIAMIGMILAVFQVISDFMIGLLICVVLTPLLLYFILNEERIKVK